MMLHSTAYLVDRFLGILILGKETDVLEVRDHVLGHQRLDVHRLLQESVNVAARGGGVNWKIYEKRKKKEAKSILLAENT